MRTFANKEKRSAPAVRRCQPSRFGYRGPEVKAQQAEIHRILRSTGAQTKLTIDQPNDVYKQEADRAADQVMAIPNPKLQRQAEVEEEETLQAKTVPGHTHTVGATTQANIQSLRGGGQPLPSSQRTFYESRMGHDFSAVRIHAGTQAADTAQSLQAKAFTLGNNIVFNTGRYSPNNPEGQKLLAHELTHVVQQNGGRSLVSAHKNPANTVPNSQGLNTVSLQLVSKLISKRNRARGSWSRPEIKKARRRAGARREPFLPVTQIHGVRSRLQPEAVLKPVVEYVVPQATSEQAGHYSPDKTSPQEVSRISRDVVQRALLPVAQIKSDIEQGTSAHPDLLSWVQVLGEQTGHIAHAADFPGGRRLTRMPSPVPAPDPQPVPIVSQWPIEAYFFPAHVQHTDRRALIMGGFHGDERPGYEMVEAFRDSVRQGQVPLAFHTCVIPRVNRGAIEDDLAGVTWYDRRGNRQFVDLNRNYRVPGAPTPTFSSRARNTHRAPIQPETQGVINVIRDFQPHRILSAHAVSSRASAGIFADPNTHPTATQLALAMAGRLAHASDRPANRLGTRRPNAVYPGDRPGRLPSEPSLGRYAPGASRPGHMTPVITVEAPEYHSLAGTGVRSRAGYTPALAGFVAEPSTLANADLQIVRDIQAMNLANRRLFLTGRMASTAGIQGRIRTRISNAVALLNRLHPRRPVPVSVISRRRAFGTRIGRSSSQAKIVFEKFTLTGGRASGWDTLPSQYYLGGNRSSGVDRAAWQAEASARRLQIILRFSAIPGASRHHWGTDVDFNSVTNRDWAAPGPGRPRGGPLHHLGQWLEQNGPRVGFFRTYTTGRTGGHAPEPWHYSYEPIARPLRQAYNRDVRLQQDIVDPIMHDWTSRARAARVTLPADLPAALAALDLSQYVNRIGPGL